MAEPAPNAPQRIDAALTRIEAALAARAEASESLSRRHAALKARMAEAVAALDDVIARGAVGLMAEVALPIGGRTWSVACAPGAEARVRMLGEVIDSHWAAALKAAGGFNTERAMFLVALMLADKMEEALTRPPSEGTMSEPALQALAERLERLADTLEQTPANA